MELGDDMAYVGLIMPSAWTAAAITFQVAAAMSNGAISPFGNLHDDTGAEVTILAANVAPDRAITISSFMISNGLRPWRYIKIRSGTFVAPVAQTAERVIHVVAEG